MSYHACRLPAAPLAVMPLAALPLPLPPCPPLQPNARSASPCLDAWLFAIQMSSLTWAGASLVLALLLCPLLLTAGEDPGPGKCKQGCTEIG